jgi:hypothetical protein
MRSCSGFGATVCGNRVNGQMLSAFRCTHMPAAVLSGRRWRVKVACDSIAHHHMTMAGVALQPHHTHAHRQPGGTLLRLSEEQLRSHHCMFGMFMAGASSTRGALE